LIACSAVSKKLEEKRLRREAEERKQQERRRSRRNRNLVTAAIAVVVAVLVGFLIFSERSEEESFESVSAGQAGCTEIEEPEEMGANHVNEGTAVQYNTTPPTSGDHYGQTASGGFSATALQPENVVHNMEHGQIIVWYDPGAPGATVESIEAYVDGAGIGMVATPYDQVPDGKSFTLTAWGAMQSCDEVSEEVLDNFRSQYQGRGPEQVGIPTFDG
jgi:hypothetical protein